MLFSFGWLLLWGFVCGVRDFCCWFWVVVVFCRFYSRLVFCGGVAYFLFALPILVCFWVKGFAYLGFVIVCLSFVLCVIFVVGLGCIFLVLVVTCGSLCCFKTPVVCLLVFRGLA